MHLILFLLSFSLLAAANDSKDAFDKSYPRDNTFCLIDGKRIEFLIRGGGRFTEPKEQGYGELIFFRLPSQKPMLLRSHISGDTYRLFPKNNSLCTKSYAYKIDKSTYAVLFLKENHPFKDKLIVQLLDSNTLMPKDFIETDYPTKATQIHKDGFAFRMIMEKNHQDFGKVTINDESFVFQEKVFPIWYTYAKKGFTLSKTLTYEEFPWKSYFKNKKDFLTYTKWNNALKDFENKIIYQAVSHKLKKECLLIVQEKKKILGSEAWLCHTKNAE